MSCAMHVGSAMGPPVWKRTVIEMISVPMAKFAGISLHRADDLDFSSEAALDRPRSSHLLQSEHIGDDVVDLLVLEHQVGHLAMRGPQRHKQRHRSHAGGPGQ